MLPRSQFRKYSAQEICIYMHPCETSKRHMYPCETLERHMCPCEILERKMHPSLWDIRETDASTLWDMYLHASLWDIRETDASILGRGCIQHQVLSAIPFNINMIQVCKKWKEKSWSLNRAFTLHRWWILTLKVKVNKLLRWGRMSPLEWTDNL